MYERKGLLNLDEVLPFVVFGAKTKKPTAYKYFDSIKINMSSQRYQLFSLKGVSCVVCKVSGQYFAIERSFSKVVPNKSGWHLNLYALNEHNEEVLMTKDHILPRSKGGGDVLENYQTMCSKCNGAKGNTLEPD